jgi:hypothetical protein
VAEAGTTGNEVAVAATPGVSVVAPGVVVVAPGVVVVDPALVVVVAPGVVVVDPGLVVVVAPGVVVVDPALVVVVAPGVVVVVLVVVVDPGVVVVVAPGVVVVVVVVGSCAAHVDVVMVSVSNVTAPLLASTRPSTVTPVVTVMEVRARMVPRKLESVPSVAELPTCQKTLQDWASLIKLTWLADAVVSVEPAWKTKTALGSPPPLSVRAPVSPIEEAEL